jgi:hypothetical protein
MAALRGTREIGFLGDGHEVAQLSQFHVGSSMIGQRIRDSDYRPPRPGAPDRRFARHFGRSPQKC